MHIKIIRYLLSLVVVVAFALIGCGPSGPTVIPVTGTVTLDGSPVANASVMFKPVDGGNPAEGITDDKGNFQLTTRLETKRDGAIEGEHIVTVTGVRTIGSAVAPDGTQLDASIPKQEWFVPMKFADGNTSGLRQTVAKGMAPVELKLSTK